MLRERIAKFDADDALATLVETSLRGMDEDAPRRPSLSSSRDQFYRIRQELLEEIFLPAEDEISWDQGKIAKGLDGLDAVELSRREEITALKQNGSTDAASTGNESHTPATTDVIARIDDETTELYRVAYLGLRIFVRPPLNRKPEPSSHHDVGYHPSRSHESS